MNVDVLVFGNSRGDEQKNCCNVLLPVYAIECEAKLPINTELDVYEETILKFLEIGLRPSSIRNAINVTPGMLDTVFSQLQNYGYAEKKRAVGWIITERGKKYLDNDLPAEQISKNSEYGYMFVSALRKDVLCYFHRGPIDKVFLKSTKQDDFILGRAGGISDTFSGISVSSRQLGRAYAMWHKLNNKPRNDEANSTKSEIEEFRLQAEQLFSDLESYDEVEETPLPERNTLSAEERGIELPSAEQDSEKKYIRKLETPPKCYYIQLKLVFDPSKLNGYDVESPFAELRGIDSPWFVRQLQWMSRTEEIMLGDMPLHEFLERECIKLGGATPITEKDVSVHMLRVIPRLKYHKEKFPILYNIYPELYALEQRATSLLDKEGVIAQYCTKLLEPLFNAIFKTVPDKTLSRIQGQITREDRAGEADLVCKRIESVACVY